MEASFGCIFNLAGYERRGRRCSMTSGRINGQGGGQRPLADQAFPGSQCRAASHDLMMENRGLEGDDMAKVPGCMCVSACVRGGAVS